MLNKIKYKLILGIWIIIILFCISFPGYSFAQSNKTAIFGHAKSNTVLTPYIKKDMLKTLHFRNIGPIRGGRSLAVSGVVNDIYTYYVGFTGGGVYKTTDGGITWKNVSDGYFKTGDVGSIAVAPSDSNVVYVGMGEKAPRGNTSVGDGMYKSTDAGKTWQYIGLGQSMVIADIAINPGNPDIVWVAALGMPFGTKGNAERGVFKTTDGGKTWRKVLYNGKLAGAADLALDPNNPNIIYASLWQVYRTPWSFASGGPGSGLYKSTDGGNTWENITHNSGLPSGIDGKIRIDVSPANSNRVYAMVENKNGGLYRSDDAGKTWKLINDSNKITQRAWYFSGVQAGPGNEDVVYLGNVRFFKSTDGGKTLKRVGTPHSDNHSLWINPKHPTVMIVADDGGGQITFNGGKSWSSNMEYATGQFYKVVTDHRFPYRVYGAQQDDGSLVIKNRTAGRRIGIRDWTPIAGGEAGWIAPDPDNPNVTYVGNQENGFQRGNIITKQVAMINIWPIDPTGHGAGDVRDRFQWTYPIYISPHNSNELFATSQYVYRSYNRGQKWERISPDLTRNEKSKQGLSGGPITLDNNGPEYYNTIFAFRESPIKQGILWAGSDDGLIHLSRDNGKTWTDVTPPALKDASNRARINRIAPSPFNTGGLYVAATRYKQGNFEPLLFKTKNFGETWTKIINGIGPKDFTRTIIPDPYRKGLLFAGTETGLYISYSDGKKWTPFKLNFPVVPVTDLTVQRRAKDLVVATQGRSFWILDDLGILEQINNTVKSSANYLFKPETAYLFGRSSRYGSGSAAVGENPPRGVVVHYKLSNPGKEKIQLQFLENDGTIIRTFISKDSTKENKKGKKNRKRNESPKITKNEGMNEFVWNMRYKGAREVNRPQVFWGGSLNGPTAIPGTYKVRLLINGQPVMEQPFKIKKDPRISTTHTDFAAKFKFQRKVVAKLDTVQKYINTILKTKKNINNIIENKNLNDSKKKTLKSDLKKLDVILNNLMNTESKVSEDPLGHPVRIADRIAVINRGVATGDRRPPEQYIEAFKVMSKRADIQLKRLKLLFKRITNQQIREF